MDLNKIIESVRKENPYPDDIWEEPTKEDFKAVAKLLADNNYSPGVFFASWGRKVWKLCCDKLIEYTLEEDDNQ